MPTEKRMKACEECMDQLLSFLWHTKEEALTGVIPASRLSFSDMITWVEFHGWVASVLASPTLRCISAEPGFRRYRTYLV
jgi:hypothetical protein